MTTHLFPFLAAIVIGLSLVSCSCGSDSKNQDKSSEERVPVKRWSPPIYHPSEDISFYWNEWDEYGTYFPTILGDEIDLPENLKGFGVKNEEDCEFYADYMHDYLDGDGEMRVTLEYLKDSPGPKTILDTIYVEGDFIVMRKYVACDIRFFQYWCKFPASKEQTYGKLFRQCMDKFPEFTKFE